MASKKTFNPITYAYFALEQGVFITFEDGTELEFSIDSYKEWLEKAEDLEPWTSDQGDYYDDGEGSYSPALVIDWVEAFESLTSLDHVKRFYKSHANTIIT